MLKVIDINISRSKYNIEQHNLWTNIFKMVETKLNIQKVANLRIMEDEKIDMENINYQGGDEYVLIIIEKS